MRAAFDKLLSGFGLALALVLLIAGGLLTWANAFVGDQVHSQLSAQDITMPQGPALESLDPADAAALQPFAGEPMTTGPAARAYADHFILAHMNAGSVELQTEVAALGVDTTGWTMPMTYQSAGTVVREINAAENLTDEQKTEASELVDEFRGETLFKGNTLRGLLLYGFAFATIGTIAGWAAVAAFGGAVVLLILAGLGLAHARKAAAGGTAPVVAEVKTPVKV